MHIFICTTVVDDAFNPLRLSYKVEVKYALKFKLTVMHC